MSNRDIERYGLCQELAQQDRLIIALDCLDHRKRDKPSDSAKSGCSRMTSNVVSFMDERFLETTDLISYAMGSGITLTSGNPSF